MMPPAGKKPSRAPVNYEALEQAYRESHCGPPAFVPPVDPPPPSVVVVPKPRRRPTGLTLVQRSVTPLEEAAFATVEQELGGRQALVTILSGAQLPPAMEKILGMMADPQHDGSSLAKVCALGDVSLKKLLDVFRTATLTRGQLHATVRIARKLPEVAEQVMDDALPGFRICHGCKGARTIVAMVPGEKRDDPPVEATIPCPTCAGRGDVYWKPEHDTQKTALMIGGLLDKGGPKITTIVANQNLNAGTDSGSYDSLIGALDKAIHGDGRARGHKHTVDGDVREVIDGVQDGSVAGLS